MLVFLNIHLTPRSTLFPYTTLFRSARTAYQRCVAVHSAYAEGAHANERATGQRDQRYQRADWPGDYQRDIAWGTGPQKAGATADRKSTRLNSSHTVISYAVFCLKK